MTSSGGAAAVSGMVLLGMMSLKSTHAVVDVGGAHACATIGTTVTCWGSNQWGQLGRGDTNTTGDDPNEMGDNLIAVNLGTGAEVSDMALGEVHSCALLTSGNVKCFGKNDKGQLGLGDNDNRGGSASDLGDALPAVNFGTGLTATALTAGCQHSCALLSNGAVKCFGYNNYGQLGQGTTDNSGDEPGEMGDNLPAVDLGGAVVTGIAAGCDFTCALTDDGSVMCWGRNTWGQLGTGDGEDRLDGTNEVLVAVDLDDSTARDISAGEAHVCALMDDSSVKCWGRNNHGQLGLGDEEDRGDTPESLGGNLSAVAYATSDVVAAIDLGSFHTCALLGDGNIKCFGENGDGELGIGSTSDVGGMPADMGDNLVAVDLGDTATDFAAGGSSSCATLSDDSVKCWGRGRMGQLGQGDDEDIGDIPGVLSELDAVDLGSDNVSPTPAPFLTSTVTSAPSAASGVSVAPTSAEMAESSQAPGATAAPLADTAAPSSADVDAESTSGASARFAGGFLATAVLGAAVFSGMMTL